MSNQTLGIIIGGLIPACIFGITGILQKYATQAGIGLGPLVLHIGLGVLLAGGVIFWVVPDRTITGRAGAFALGLGVSWAIGTALIALALISWKIPISKLVPLYNMNTLVTTVLGLLLFAEWKNINVPVLLIGAGLIIIGGILVARA